MYVIKSAVGYEGLSSASTHHLFYTYSSELTNYLSQRNHTLLIGLLAVADGAEQIADPVLRPSFWNADRGSQWEETCYLEVLLLLATLTTKCCMFWLSLDSLLSNQILNSLILSIALPPSSQQKRYSIYRKSE